jgi:hypothetical protein
MPVNTTNVSLAGGSGSPATAGSIRGEFPKTTNTNPTSLSQFYRGGPNVSTFQGDAGFGVIPTSGPISFGPFRNQSRVGPIASTNGLWNISLGTGPAPVTIVLDITWQTGGGVNYNVGSSSAANWFNPVTVGAGNGYWIRGTVTAQNGFGVLTGPSGWVQMNSPRTWSLTYSDTVSGSATRTITIEFATDSAGTNIVATHTGITFVAFIDF